MSVAVCPCGHHLGLVSSELPRGVQLRRFAYANDVQRRDRASPRVGNLENDQQRRPEQYPQGRSSASQDKDGDQLLEANDLLKERRICNAMGKYMKA